MPADVPVSAGLKRIQAPATEATTVAAATPVPAVLRLTMYSSTLSRRRRTYRMPRSAERATVITITGTTRVSLNGVSLSMGVTRGKNYRPPALARGGLYRIRCSPYPSAGITQIRFVGSSRPGRDLSAWLTKLPLVFGFPPAVL